MIDIAEIQVKAGDGGDGSINFHREKFVPLGGPDGGDGGKGGNVIVRADSSVTTLRAFQYKRHYQAQDGGNGQDNQKHGKNGDDLFIEVPEGTVVWEKTADGNVLLADVEHSGEEVIVAYGGKGGWGNTHFASSTNQAPYVAQVGESGEGRVLVLELRVIADAGIVGYPNAGKSTLLTRATAARPRIASYPFTTLEPVLGVVEVNEHRFVLAEIPGLIPGAHLGKGLGYDFLRHVTRTKVLIHLVDGSSPSPIDDMITVNNELSLFDVSLAQKPQLVAINKIDLPQVKQRVNELKDEFAAAGIKPWFISAATGEGVREVMAAADKMIRSLPASVDEVREEPKIFRPRPVDKRGATVRKEGDTFIVMAPDMERLVTRRGEKYRPELLRHLRREIVRRGIKRALERAGIKAGDKVRCGKVDMEW